MKSADEQANAIPEMDLDKIREYATGPYAVFLSMKCLVYARALSRNIIVRKAKLNKTARTRAKIENEALLVKVSGSPSPAKLNRISIF